MKRKKYVEPHVTVWAIPLHHCYLLSGSPTLPTSPGEGTGDAFSRQWVDDYSEDF